MYGQSISSYVERTRKEIKLIQNREFFYRKSEYHTLEQMTAHELRGTRLVEIQEELEKLRSMQGRFHPTLGRCLIRGLHGLAIID